VVAAMDPDARLRRRACVEFGVKLSRDTGANLSAAACEDLLATPFTFEGEHLSLQSNPGRFYTCLGAAIANQSIALVIPNRLKVACWCYREAAEVHAHPAGMLHLAACLYWGHGVTEDRAQAVAWYQKAADLGNAASSTALGELYLQGDASAGVAKDAARGFDLFKQAVARGFGPALYLVAQCYLKGEGVEKDAAHAVKLLRRVVARGDAGLTRGDAKTAKAQSALARCYHAGEGVKANTVKAAAWCQRAAAGGDAQAVEMLPFIRTCDFCGATPARQLCVRCLKARYCDAGCQRLHWWLPDARHKVGRCKLNTIITRVESAPGFSA
jgi:hypothetical protein